MSLHPSPQPDDLIRRLRARSSSAWDEPRLAAARAVCQHLADLAADADGRPRIPVPDLAPFAVVDQLAVLFADACTAGAEAGATREIAELATTFGW